MQHAPKHHETTCMGLRYPPLKYYGHRPPSGQTRDLHQLRVVGRARAKKNSYMLFYLRKKETYQTGYFNNGH